VTDLKDIGCSWRYHREQLTIVERERDRLIRQAHADGMSLRQIAREAGVSFQRVAQIINAGQ
jgi:transposase